MNVLGLLFDMDGLLFSTEEVYYETTQKAAEKYQLPFTREAYIEHFLGIDEERIVGTYLTFFQQYDQNIVYKFIRKANEYANDRIKRGDVKLKTGALDLLKWAKERGIPCVIVSNNTRGPIERLLETHQIREYFKEIFSTEDVKKGKPDPELVLKAVDFLKGDKKEFIMLEDSYLGMKGSHAAGVPAYLIPDMLPPTREMKEIATKIFNSLTDVKSYLEKELS